MQLANTHLSEAIYTIVTAESLQETWGQPQGHQAGPDSEHEHSLYLCKIEEMENGLFQLLNALLSPRMPLRRLSLDFSNNHPPEAAAVTGCWQHFSALSALRLAAHHSLSSPEAALQALVEQAPALMELSVNGCLRGAFPAFLPIRTGLQSLNMSNNQLPELPDGLYLSGKLHRRSRRGGVAVVGWGAEQVVFWLTWCCLSA